MRQPKEKAIDNVLLLYLIEKCAKAGETVGRTKLQKLVFLSEMRLMKEEIDAFHLKFFRYQFGPFSKELLMDCNELYENEFIGYAFTPKYKANYLLEYTFDSLNNYKDNKLVFEIIDETCKEFGKLSRSRLVDIVYAIKIKPFGMSKEIKIRDIPTFVDILEPQCFEGKYKFEIPDELLEEIQSEFNAETLTASEAKKAINEAGLNLIAKIKENINPEDKNDFIQRMKQIGISQEFLSKVFAD